MIFKVILVVIVMFLLYTGYEIFKILQEIHLTRKINRTIIKDFEE